VSNGLVTNDYGGGIRNSGTLLINNSRFVNNLSAGSSCCSGGGGISSEGVLTVTHSIVSGNSSALGAGINTNGPTALVDTRINGNTASETGGGVVIFTGGRATISGGEIFSNTTTSDTVGGGAGIYSADTLTLDGVKVYGNTTARIGGGILNGGVLTATRSTLSSNSATGSGSALYTTGSLNVSSSTISDNHPGIIVHVQSSTLLMRDSTVSSNSGDGIYQFGAIVTLVNDTINQNTGYGIVNSMFTKNTIIANSGSGVNCLFANPGYTQGFNLSNDTSCMLNGTGDQQGIPVLLGPLAVNGGPTLTHMPSAGSPAIDKGSGCSPLDQRGAPRVGAACDVGSVEHGSFPPELFLPLIRR
jgi:predicted outer membrane repeat protein